MSKNVFKLITLESFLSIKVINTVVLQSCAETCFRLKYCLLGVINTLFRVIM